MRVLVGILLMGSIASANQIVTCKGKDIALTVGTGSDVVQYNYKGKDFAIAFNPEYLSDPLKTLDADEVFLDFTDELSPGVVRCQTPFLYVIMPMRTA